MPQNKSILLELRNYLLINLGLNFTENQEKILYDRIKLAGKRFDFKSTDGFIHWILNSSLDSSQIEQLSTFLTIGETYFFREKKMLDYLEYDYLPKLINRRDKTSCNRVLKIWCAGCSTGEEPYAIAIILRRIIPNIDSWNISILATDINPSFIKKGKKGIYSKWSFRGMSESFMDKYFEKLGDNTYQIFKEIREMVTFKSLNLIKEKFPLTENNTSEIDVILCRNVMIYFSKEGANAVVDKFSKSLVDDGLFMVSSVEVPIVGNSKLKPIVYNGNTVFIKGDNRRLKNFQNGSDKSWNGAHASFVQENILKSKSLTRIKVITPIAKKIIDPKVIESFKSDSIKNGSIEALNYQEAKSLYESGLIDMAEEILEINHLENNDEVLLLKAKIKADKGMLDVSEGICLKVIEANKINFEAHFLLSTVFSEQGKLKEAIKSLKNSLFLKPDFALGHFLLGNIAMRLGEELQSKKHYRIALKMLENLKPDLILDESNGLTASRLTTILEGI